MRYFLFSTIMHLLLLVFGIAFTRETLDFQMVGDPTITMSMVGEGSHAGGRAEDLSLGKSAAPESKPKPAKLEKKRKAVKEKPEVVEKEVKREVEVPVETVEEVIPEKVPEEKVEKPAETEKVEVTEDEVSHEVSDATIDADTTEDSQVTDEEGETTPESDSNSKAVKGSQEMGEGFIQLADGAWAAKNQGVKGLSYGLLAQPEPEYPAIARKMGVDHEVVIKVRFLIGYKGRVEDIRFYDDVTNFGFREEVVKTLKNWRATPIEVEGRKIKLYFYKTFRFEKLG
ncbi:hypothetical protein PM10SUCC1_27830 [Propionigenium maris DSM 9537]|uniref:TonB C-terminal domain-containing protein n=1 Tax=Propionigenium maris DSM 9537 TaxID=1123000 RepID=A0A9W6GNV4_9FUSO|nr:energy transducer TonB [Propionigenium maris]GLI57269.1 hypothetical protein PM10SUCC1_27830 [Propionigenium maris DSM 9537]